MADAWSILGGPSQQHQSEHWPPWRLVETHWVPDLELGPLGVWDGSDRRSATGHLHARPARILITRRPVPPLPHRARTFHQRAKRVFASRGPASAWTSQFLVTLDVVIAKIIESDLAVSSSPHEDQQLESTADGRLHRVRDPTIPAVLSLTIELARWPSPPRSVDRLLCDLLRRAAAGRRR
jgi:hypothetical protein